MAKKSYDTRDKGSLIQDSQGRISTDPEKIMQKSSMRHSLDRSGVGYEEMNDYGDDFERMYEAANPTEHLGSKDMDFQTDWNEFEKSWYEDALGGLYNAGVVGMGEGLASMPAMVGTAISRDLGSDSAEKFFVNWTDNVDKWADGMEYNPSDKALGITGGDWNTNKIMYGVGEGVGFIGSLVLGGKGVGLLSKAAKAQQVGRFAMGTMQMAPDIYEEGLESGLSPAAAARMAFGISGVVSLTEGAALEAIGKTFSKPVSGKAARSALKDQLKTFDKKTLKNFSMFDMKKSLPELTSKFSTKMKGYGAKAFEGFNIEAGQEFSQTYIEERMKQMYDEMYAVGKKSGDGKFGADVKSKQTFMDAAFGGLVGGLVGGGMSAYGSLRHGIKAETVFGHINDSVNKKNYKNIKNLKTQVSVLAAEGKLNETPEYVNSEIDKMVAFSKRTNGLNIKSPTANFQLYQIMGLEDQMTTKFDAKFSVDKRTHGLVKKAFEQNAKAAEQVLKGLEYEMDTIINDKEPVSWNRTKFDGRLEKYRGLMKQVIDGKLDSIQANKAVFDMMLPKVRKRVDAEDKDANLNKKPTEAPAATESASAVPKKDFDYYDLGSNKKVSQEAIDDKMTLLDEYENAIASGDMNKMEAFQKKAMTEYGMTLEDMDSYNEGGENYDNVAKLSDAIKAGEIKSAKAEKSTSKEEPKAKKKVKGYRTEGTFSSKVNYAQRGSGKYTALDKPFSERGSDEKVSEVEVEYDEDTTLDATTPEGQKEFMEIKRKALEGKKFNSIQEQNDAVKDAMREAGYTALIGNIDEDNKDAGRELVNYDEATKSTEVSKGEKYNAIKKKYPNLTINRNIGDEFEMITASDNSAQSQADLITATREMMDAGFTPKVRTSKGADTVNNAVSLDVKKANLIKEISVAPNEDVLDRLMDQATDNDTATMEVMDAIGKRRAEMKGSVKGNVDGSTYDPKTDTAIEIEAQRQAELNAKADLEGATTIEGVKGKFGKHRTGEKPKNTKSQNVTIAGKVYRISSELYDDGTAIFTVSELDTVGNSTDNSPVTAAGLPIKDLTESDYEAIAALNEAGTEAEADAKAKPNSQLSLNDFLNFDLDEQAIEDAKKLEEQQKKDDSGKEQRDKGSAVNAGLISANKELYNKIRNHFRKLFPNIPLHEFDKIAWKYGPSVLAKVTQQGVSLNTDTAIQTSLAHEFAHIYFKLMGGANSWVGKTGFAQMKGTQFERDARNEYPDKTEAEIMEEALMEAVGEKSLEKLKVKLEGKKFEKFMAWMQQFWRKVKRMFQKANSVDIAEMMSDALVYPSGIVNVGTGFLADMNKDQRSKEYVAIGSMLQSSLVQTRVAYMLDNTNPDPRNNMNMYTAAGMLMAQEFKKERTNKNPDSAPMVFDNLPSDLLERMNALEGTDKNPLAVQEARLMISEIAKYQPQVYELIEKSASSIAKKPLPTLDDIENQISSAVKGNQKISDSVRSIITSLIDFDGGLIQSNNVYQYIANNAMNTIGSNGFYESLENDARGGQNMVAQRLYEMLSSLDENTREGILNEVQSIIQIRYKSLVLESGKGEEGMSLREKNINENQDSRQFQIDVASHFSTLSQFEISRIKELSKQFSLSEIVNDGMTNPRVRAQIIEYLGLVTQEEFTDQEIKDYLEEEYLSSPTSAKNFLNRRINDVLEGKEEIKHISSHLKRLSEQRQDGAVDHTFVNSSGNNVTSSRLGYWISELGALIKTNPNYRAKLNRSDVYKNNPVLKYMEKNGSYWFIHDAISNALKGKATEFNKQNESDGLMNDLGYFAINASKRYYSQRIGVNGDRTHATYMRVPRHTASELKTLYTQRAQQELDQFGKRIKRIYGKDLNEMTPDQIKEDVDLFNKLTLNQLEYSDGKWDVLTPYSLDSNGNPKIASIGNKVKSAIQTLKTALSESGLTEAMQKNLVVGKEKVPPIYKNLDEMLQTYVLNENLNRSYLEDLYAGPATDRKSVSDVVKRMSGMNSGGKHIPVNKPVRVLVINSESLDVLDEKGRPMVNSDSMSFNGSHFHENLTSRSGPLDQVGLNVKDGLYQIDPDTGHLMYLKMSSFGVTGEVGANSMYEMSPADRNSSGEMSYSAIGDAILRFEKGLAEQIGDEKPYVKVIDIKALKGIIQIKDGPNKGKFIMGDTIIEPIDVNDFVNQSKTPEGVTGLVNGNSNFDQDFNNYRVSFNLNKNLSKVSLSEQSVILSTQLSKIVLDYNGQPVDQFESDMVALLKNSKEQLNMVNSGDYESSEVYKKMKKSKSLIEGLLQNADDQEKTEIVALLEDIQKWNEANKSDANKQITVFDHQNLVNLIQNLIGSKLTKKGVRVSMPGAYLHMVPNYGSDLNWYETDANGDMTKATDIALPWSMFADSREKAEALLKSNPEMFRVATVRVPASGPVSGFASVVKYFVDGDSNTSVLPDQFMKASDADHDADKVFVYRQELDDEGKLVPGSEKSKVFENLWNQLTSKEMIAGTIDNSLDLDQMKTMVTEAIGDSSTETFSLEDLTDMNSFGNKMSFGADAIGIWAVASKMMSVLSQSNEQLKETLMFNGKPLRAFTNEKINDVALFLQAALDMGNDPVLITTGVNKHTVNVATTLTLLGVDTQEVIKFLNNEGVKELVRQLESKEGSYSLDDDLYITDFVDKYRGSLENKIAPVVKEMEDSQLDYVTERNGLMVHSKIRAGYNQTSQGQFFFAKESGKSPGGVNQWLLNKVDKSQVKGSEDFLTIDKFVEITAISNDIKKLIPVLQLDNKLPNTVEGLMSLKDTFNTLEGGSNPLSITVGSVLERPLVKHYREMAKLVDSLYKDHFFTASPQMQTVAREMAVNMHKNVTQNKINTIYTAMKNTMMKYFAQKVFMKGVEYSDPTMAMNDLSVKVENVILSDEAPITLTNTGAGGLLKINTDKGRSIEEWKQVVREEYPTKADAIIEEYNRMSKAKELGAILKDNKFLKYIQVIDNKSSFRVVDDKKVYNKMIVGKRSIASLNDTAREEVAKDFDKIRTIDIDLYNGLVHHQMMRFGMENKISGYSGIMPSKMSMTYLSHVSQKSKYIEGFFEKNAQVTPESGATRDAKDTGKLVQANTAIELKDTLPKPTDVKKVVVNGRGYVQSEAQSDFINYDDLVYMRKKDNNYVAIEEGGIFKDEKYTQFAKSIEQLARRKEVTQAELDELNKCKS